MPFFFLSGEDIVKDVMPHMVLDHNGSFSLIPSSQIPSFLQQSIERKDQLPVICRQSNNTLEATSSFSVKTMAETAVHQAKSITPTPVQQMKSIITANLQQLKSIDSSSPKTETRHNSISLLANKTDARHSTSLNTSTPVHFIVHSKKSVKEQLNENSVQKVAVISSTDNCARLVRDDQKKIQEQNKGEISSNNLQFQILSEIQPSQKEMSEQSSAVSSHIDFQLAPQHQIAMEDLSSGNLVELNSEVNNAETGLSMTGVSILAGTQKEVPVSIRTGLYSSDNGQVPVTLDQISLDERLLHNQQQNIQQNITKHIMWSQNEETNQTGCEIPEIHKQIDHSKVIKPNQIKLSVQNEEMETRKAKSTLRKDSMTYQKYIHTKSIAENNRKEVTPRHSVSLLKQEYIQKLKETQNCQRSNDHINKTNVSTSIQFDSIGSCRSTKFEKSIAIQTDPVNTNIYEGNIFPYMPDKQAESHVNVQNVMHHQVRTSEHERTIYDLNSPKNNEQDGSSNEQETHFVSKQVQHPVSEICLAQENLDMSNYISLNRNLAQKPDVALSLPMNNQEKKNRTEQPVCTESLTGIQYVVQKTSAGNFCVPVISDQSTKAGEITQSQTVQVYLIIVIMVENDTT